jgi:ribulose-phosphate 3-epimerase
MNKIKISPSILSADFSMLGTEIEKLREADYIHIDVMDGHFVPNLTFGVKLIKDIRRYTNQVFDVHLMVDKPEEYIGPMADAGADIITVHWEACTHLTRTINEIKKHGVRAGLALVPTTHENVLKYIIGDLDLVLVMTVNPGFGGQKFIKSQLEKIVSVRKMIGDSNRDIDLEVDGGIDDITAKSVISAGANVLVAGSYIFGDKDYNTAIKELKS